MNNESIPVGIRNMPRNELEDRVVRLTEEKIILAARLVLLEQCLDAALTDIEEIRHDIHRVKGIMHHA